jgi:hypothetical protein
MRATDYSTALLIRLLDIESYEVEEDPPFRPHDPGKEDRGQHREYGKEVATESDSDAVLR